MPFLQVSDGARSTTQLLLTTRTKRKAELNALKRGQSWEPKPPTPRQRGKRVTHAPEKFGGIWAWPKTKCQAALNFALFGFQPGSKLSS